jgi:hypothetical protein
MAMRCAGTVECASKKTSSIVQHENVLRGDKALGALGGCRTNSPGSDDSDLRSLMREQGSGLSAQLLGTPVLTGNDQTMWEVRTCMHEHHQPENFRKTQFAIRSGWDGRSRTGAGNNWGTER